LVNSGDLLVSIATGMRPSTAQIALKALELSLKSLPVHVPAVRSAEIHVVCWDGNEVPYYPYGLGGRSAAWQVRHGPKAECLNSSLERYGKLPEWWLTLDDDAVIGERTVPALMSILEVDPSVGLVGAWNDLSEPDRGVLVPQAGHQVQYGVNFCVGGALHLIPRRTLETVGSYDAALVRHEDAEYSARVRAAGMHAVLVRDVAVALLPDDGVVPSYRDRILAMHYSGWDPRSDRKEELA